jgi:broad specificity phosphatase PhoE
MKWPHSVWFVRHGESAYNVQRDNKLSDPAYQRFVAAYQADWRSPETRALAEQMWRRFDLGLGDWNMPMTERGVRQSRALGMAMGSRFELPDVIFTSPHDRAWHTLRMMIEGWPELANVRVIEEPRLHEQDHGLVGIYNDWRIFTALNPEQKMLQDLVGDYWYRFPQGENMFDVVERMRSFIGTIARDHSECRVGVITHHMTILSFLAALLRWNHHEFLEWRRDRRPINCGLTLFRGNPDVGDEGKLELVEYNTKLFED